MTLRTSTAARPASPDAPEWAPERRKKRSDDPLVALHYQLATAQRGEALDALVLADPSGVVVAGAGAWVVCEELAAYAPLFAAAGVAGARDQPALPSRMEDLRTTCDVRAMTVEGQAMLLCAFGRAPASRARASDHAAGGIARILESRG